MESFDTTGLDQKVLPDQIKTAYANNHVVLSNLYKIVQPLSSLFPLHLHDQLLYPTDTVEYSFLFHKTLVGSNIKVDFMPLDQRALPDSSMEPGGRMKDIIESAQRIIWSEFVMDLKLQKLALEEYKKHQFGKGKDVGLNNNCNNLLVLGFGRVCQIYFSITFHLLI